MLGAILALIVIGFPGGIAGIGRRPAAQVRGKSAHDACCSKPAMSANLRRLPRARATSAWPCIRASWFRSSGPNGAGKTTLVNLLTGLIEPTAGDVCSWAGTSPASARSSSPITAWPGRFSSSRFFRKLTVAETIAAAVVSRQKKRWRLFSRLAADGAVIGRVREVAEIFGLRHRLDTVAAALSQGEKKLLDVASAFALDPQVILLDEPTSGVSTADKHGIMKTLIAAAKRAGVKGILLVEHDMDLVAAYSHRIIALSEGKVLADLPPDAVLRRPASDRDRRRQAAGALMLRGARSCRRHPGQPRAARRLVRGEAGEFVCLVGRNGAGKTTTLAHHHGLSQAGRGHDRFRRPGSLSACGPIRSRAGDRLRAGRERGVRRTHRCREHRHAHLDLPERRAPASSASPRPINVFPRLERYRERGGQALSGGERKMVSIARALALGPKLLLLDEPTEGLSPAIVPSIIDGLANIRAFGHAVFIAESNVHHVPEFTDGFMSSNAERLSLLASPQRREKIRPWRGHRGYRGWRSRRIEQGVEL